MIKQECIGIPDMILLLMIFCFKKIKIKAEIVLSPGGAYFEIKTRWPKALELRVAKSSQVCSKAANVEFVIDLTVLTTNGRRYP